MFVDFDFPGMATAGIMIQNYLSCTSFYDSINNDY